MATLDHPELRESLNILLKNSRPRLERVLRNFEIPPEDAEDILQDAQLTLLYKWDKIRSPESWLIGTVKKKCIMYWRKRRGSLCDAVDTAILDLISVPQAPKHPTARPTEVLQNRIALVLDASTSMARFRYDVERVVAAINEAIRDLPPDRIRLHVCWGNSESPHDADVPLDDILPALQQANVGGFVLPFANPRHAHEFRCFAKHPLADDQILVAGVIDSLTNFVEHPEVVADRIERVAAVIGDPTRVLAGTDCGFDTSAGWGRVAEDVVWAKLASLRDGARLASERLFSRGR